MARRRDTRIFGPGPYVLGLRREGGWGSGFPFDVPAVAAVEEVKLDRPVTLLAGENGSGKSTILEAVAESIGFGDEGGELERLGELPAVPRNVLDGALAPVLSATKPRNGYYLRAESFFNIAKFIDSGETGSGHRRRDPRLRRSAGCQPHARLPRRAGALPEGTGLRRAGGRQLIARTRPAAGPAARGPCRQRE